jgi:hypothetical protein
MQIKRRRKNKEMKIGGYKGRTLEYSEKQDIITGEH